jgi:uncharacterized protein (TIGR03086 family)
MNLPELISRAATRAGDLVTEIGQVDLDAPSTCAEFDQRALANHLTGFLPYAANAARKGPAMESEVRDFAASPEWAAEFTATAADVAAAWSEPGATEGSVQFGRGEMPAEYAAGITLMELTIHAWDLARSTGHQFSTDPNVAEAVRKIVGRAVQGGGGDFFGPPVETNSIDPLDQAVALSGRDPK